MVDRLARLRHYAVVGGYHQDGDIGRARSARAHFGKRFVAGRVDEGQQPSAGLRLIRADPLRDPARLALRHARFADRIEQARFAVVDVPQHCDHGRARAQRRRIVLLNLHRVAEQLQSGGRFRLGDYVALLLRLEAACVSATTAAVS